MDFKSFFKKAYYGLYLNEKPPRLAIIFTILFVIVMIKWPYILYYCIGQKEVTIAETIGIFLEGNVKRVNWEYKVNNVNYIGHGEMDLVKEHGVAPIGMKLYVVYSKNWPCINFLIPTIPLGTQFNPDTLNDAFCIKMLNNSQFAFKK